LKKDCLQLMEEGVAQLFSYELGNRKVIGTVGALQFEVIQFRLKNEYGATVQFASVRTFIRHAGSAAQTRRKLQEFLDSKQRHIARDKDGKLVFMAESRGLVANGTGKFP
jgi:peptide chain release factor 3